MTVVNRKGQESGWQEERSRKGGIWKCHGKIFLEVTWSCWLIWLAIKLIWNNDWLADLILLTNLTCWLTVWEKFIILTQLAIAKVVSHIPICWQISCKYECVLKLWRKMGPKFSYVPPSTLIPRSLFTHLHVFFPFSQPILKPCWPDISKKMNNFFRTWPLPSSLARD